MREGVIRTTALIGLVAGAAGSLGLLLHAGQRTPRLLMAIMATWVLSPFIALALASMVLKRLPVPAQTALHLMTLAVTLGSLAVYGDDAVNHRTAHPAEVYVIVPPVSWLLTATVVGAAAFVSRRRKAAMR